MRRPQSKVERQFGGVSSAPGEEAKVVRQKARSPGGSPRGIRLLWPTLEPPAITLLRS